MEALAQAPLDARRGGDAHDRVPRFHDWLLAPAEEVSANIAQRLQQALFGGAGTVKAAAANAALVSLTISVHLGSLLLLACGLLQMLLAATRIVIHERGNAAIESGKAPPTELYARASIGWALALGVESAVCIGAGDWIAATLVAVSGAAMAGGMCLRNFSAPRLASGMILASLGPTAVAAMATGEPVMLIAGLQLPLYMFGMTKASFYQNRLSIRMMRAEILNDHNAHHDAETGALNRVGLERWLSGASDGAKGKEAGFSFYLLEVEGLQEVRHNLGYAAGHHVAKACVQRLKQAAGEEAITARVGDGEFIVIDPGASKACTMLGKRLAESISRDPYQVGSDGASLRAHAGIAVAPEHGQTFEMLLEAADAGLYEGRAMAAACRLSPLAMAAG